MKELSILQISIYVALLIGFILILRLTCRRFFGRRFFVILWTLVLLRFLIPYNITIDIRNVFLQKVVWENSIFRKLDRELFSKAAESDMSAEGENVKADSNEEISLIRNGNFIDRDKYMAMLEEEDAAKGEKAEGKDADSSLQKRDTESVIRTVWLLVMLVLAAYYLFSYIKWCYRFSFALPVEVDFVEEWKKSHKLSLGRRLRIRKSDMIQSPLSYGLIRPTILLPANMFLFDVKLSKSEIAAGRQDHAGTTEGTTEETSPKSQTATVPIFQPDLLDQETLRMVLEHEFAHLHNLDSLLKLGMVIATCIYWYHPLIWVMDYYLQKDIELACDETVIHRLGMKARKAYAMTLIIMEEERNYFSLVYNHFKRNATEERVMNMKNMKKISTAAICISSFLVIGVTGVCAASANLIGESEAQKIQETLPKIDFLSEEGFAVPGIEWGCDLQQAADVLQISRFSSMGLAESDTGLQRGRDYIEYLGIESGVIAEMTEDGLRSLEFLIEYAENPDLAMTTILECLQASYGEPDSTVTSEVEAKAIWNADDTSLQLMYSNDGIRLILGKNLATEHVDSADIQAENLRQEDGAYGLSFLPWDSTREECEAALGIRFYEEPLLQNDEITIYESLDLASVCGHRIHLSAEFRQGALYQINFGFNDYSDEEMEAIYQDLLAQIRNELGEEDFYKEPQDGMPAVHRWMEEKEDVTILSILNTADTLSMALAKIDQ